MAGLMRDSFSLYPIKTKPIDLLLVNGKLYFHFKLFIYIYNFAAQMNYTNPVLGTTLDRRTEPEIEWTTRISK